MFVGRWFAKQPIPERRVYDDRGPNNEEIKWEPEARARDADWRESLAKEINQLYLPVEEPIVVIDPYVDLKNNLKLSIKLAMFSHCAINIYHINFKAEPRSQWMLAKTLSLPVMATGFICSIIYHRYKRQNTDGQSSETDPNARHVHEHEAAPADAWSSFVARVRNR